MGSNRILSLSLRACACLMGSAEQHVACERASLTNERIGARWMWLKTDNIASLALGTGNRSMHRACVHFQWAVISCHARMLQLMKNIDLQSCEWSASGEQFGGWRWPSDWARVGKTTCLIVCSSFLMALRSTRFQGDRFLIVFDSPRFVTVC